MRLLVCVALLCVAMCGFGQSGSYAADQENSLLKTIPGKQLFPEDVRCGDYFWKSEKADKGGAVIVYFFYGDPAYGKNKLGLYKQRAYRVVLNEEKDPPTAKVVNEGGAFKELLLQMTKAQLEASRACFPQGAV